MCIFLPKEKQSQFLKLVVKAQKLGKWKIRDLAELIGKLVFACNAIKYGHVYIKDLEYEKIKALRANNENFDAEMTLPATIKEDLAWWADNLQKIIQPN